MKSKSFESFIWYFFVDNLSFRLYVVLAWLELASWSQYRLSVADPEGVQRVCLNPLSLLHF